MDKLQDRDEDAPMGAIDYARKRQHFAREALEHAAFELTEDGEFFGTVPGLAGVWASALSRDACKLELASVLDGWLEIKQRRGGATI